MSAWLLAPLRDEQQPLCRGDERVKDALLARCALFGDGPAGREGGELPGRQIELRARERRDGDIPLLLQQRLLLERLQLQLLQLR